MPQRIRPPTVMVRARKKTQMMMIAEAKKMGKKMPDFMDMMFRKYKRSMK